MKKKIDSSRNQEIYPEEIFLDSSNLPDFDRHQFEGRIERPISKKTHVILGSFFMLIGLIFVGQVWILQIKNGEQFSSKSENNRLRHSLIFGERGVIYDRNGLLLASNTANPEGEPFSVRKYGEFPGLSLLLGYVKYPAKDSAGFYYNEKYDGKDGIEKFYNDYLSGINGLKIIETNARGQVESENTIVPPQPGKNLTLSIDSELQSQFYKIIEKTANTIGFTGGGAAIIDVKSGEIIALTSFPEYNSQVLSHGKDNVMINAFLTDSRNPFLDRVVDGLYIPGSIVKPFLALAALEEKIIDPETSILSTGSISLPNAYDPTKSTVFKDWKAHGYVNMRQAISVSSDVYFYEIGGGYKNQKGLGISLIEKYLRYFGFGQEVPNSFLAGKKGVIPNPEWKKENFDGEEWRVGNTYHTAIGQYGFQVTPIQALLGVAAIANYGDLITPTIIKGDKTNEVKKTVPIKKEYFTVIHEGMRMGVNQGGTASALNIPGIEIAAKTGTAELGSEQLYVNSWVTGFFPYTNPKYAFVVVMEKGPRSNTIGASAVAREFFEWLVLYHPEYTK